LILIAWWKSNFSLLIFAG
jgi:hypothetical protein